MHTPSGAIAALCAGGIFLNGLLLVHTLASPPAAPIFAHAAQVPGAAPVATPRRTARPLPAGAIAAEVALTFDDGPQPYYTQAVLDLLRRHRIHATFFVVGRQATAFPELVRAEAATGNEVENHTWSHANLRFRSFYDASAEIAGTADEVLLLTGRAPRYLRPPYGSVNDWVRKEAASQDEQIVLWTVDPRDWARPGVRAIDASVLSTVRNRSIILMHDGGGRRDQTLLALRTVIPTLERRGYHFVTMEQLLNAPARTGRGMAPRGKAAIPSQSSPPR